MSGEAAAVTNTQLLLAIGIPSLTVLVGILLTNRLLFEFKADLSRRLDGIDKRYDSIDWRFENIDRHFDKLEAWLERIEDDMREFFRSVTRLESRVDALEREG